MQVEYKIGSIAGAQTTQYAEKILNDLGDDGWQLIAVLKNEILIFMRSKPVALTINSARGEFAAVAKENLREAQKRYPETFSR